ncbi:DNA-directed RNA polymerase I subunit 1-like [Papaver somniferum]|uniref:DNA-directed RNA polymerase I subunit 1-like n=1 Tax=Papaver somniferum TaxID=3469 RepID=UPI000E6F54AA|nr:DNA-directed RNA polymerase I subunit 1-like [Papaver somniferum]
MTTTEGATEAVEFVSFSFLTDEEVRKMSRKKVTCPILYNNLDVAYPNGLYDPAMGPLEDKGLCGSCGQTYFECSGHCGHIDLAVPVYNPLLVRTLFQLLERTCFFCKHFRIEKEKVQKCVAQLELIKKGDITGAKNLDMAECSAWEESDSDQTACTTKPSEVSYNNSQSSEQHHWTSLQYSEAMSVLDGLLGSKPSACRRCSAKNPRISCPTFGWFYMNMSKASTRANVIQGVELNESFDDGAEQDVIGEVRHSGVSDSEDVESAGSVYNRTLSPGKKSRNKGVSGPPSEYLKQSNFFSGVLLPSEAKDHMKLVWENENQICSLICDIQQQGMTQKRSSYSMFFIEALLVAPVKFRPPSKGAMVSDHPQTVLLGKVLESNIKLANAHMNSSEDTRFVTQWRELQKNVNVLYDSKAVKGGAKDSAANGGICQLLEKKEGLFRQKMMGKRVNHACRSVISPDPYLAVNEIGIPPCFALNLTYPERVTPWNVNKLKEAILTGGEEHPGATHYVDKYSSVKLPKAKQKRFAYARKLPTSRGVLTQTGRSVEQELEGKVVYRHLRDGDIVLVNRQPTLHKPSIMAHVVRVLKGEKTLRMHYANCSVYNADFDGDEMNVHFPQDEISRAEGYHIVNANNQYLVPTSGEPKRGLIQDHIISAVLLTKKDTFFTRDEYNYLLYSSGVSAAVRNSSSGASRKKIYMINSEDELEGAPPAIWKPEPLWTGKQVISSILQHITRTRGLAPFTIEKSGKVPSEYFGDSSGEFMLRIHKNELVHGVIDKNQFEKHGLVHTVQELYGSNVAGILLSVLSRLFTLYLQMHGFTCGVDDLLIIPDVETKRTSILEKSEEIGKKVHCQFVGSADGDIDPTTLQAETEKTIRNNAESATTRLDRMMSSALNGTTSQVNKELFPKGLQKPFPKNCLSLMTTTGAKGGLVNFTQISSLLGQQELEGKRVPRMVSGKTLPCFHPWDPASRAGGFISDRFLTGLRPQEYYFHCMAGREGLVDTAVKTSRSGYLQRCLIKNLECLKVGYDHTVRDSDGSIVQFCYGEDGVDVHKTSFISEFNILAANQEVVLDKLGGGCEDALVMKFNNYIKHMPEPLEGKINEFISSLSKKQRASLQLRKKDFLKLMKLKYFRSLAQPGEPVGVLAAQSVGEPSTQMTLNTFHLAGQGEMNVTLGVPRLQEILMRASEKIQTPVMTCPLRKGKTRDDADRLAAKLKKVTVADIIEKIEVNVVPFSVYKQQVTTVFKLKIKVFGPEHFPPYMDITLEDCMQTLDVLFVRELEDSIENHLIMVFKVSGITNMGRESEVVNEEEKEKEEDKDDSSKQSHNTGEETDDDDEGDANDIEAEDLGVDAQKRKEQATDEMDYGEDGMETETSLVENVDAEGSESESESDDVGNKENDQGTDGEPQILDAEEEPKSVPASKSSDKREPGSAAKPKKVAKARRTKKESDRVFFVEAKGLDFEVHLRFTDEPHIILSKVVEKAAKNVYIKRSGNIERCSVIDHNRDAKLAALQTAGVDFGAFWDMIDDLDINHIVSNDMHTVLRTYGVEAARATIINEVKGVFDAYGIKVNIRHLTLIADYMTQTGAIRPFSRYGIASSTSPFSKMSFETAAKFIVDAAYHGEVDDLESPSARICLGLPVKVGTGSFDLLQQVF